MGSTVFFIIVSLPAVTAPKRAMARRADADGVLDLFGGQMKSASSNNRRNKGCQRGVMPTTLADSRKSCFAETLLEFMTQHQTDDQFAAIASGPLTTGNGCGKDVGRMRGILLPIDVVVVHAADHQRIRERGGYRVHLFARSDNCRIAATCNLVEHFECDGDVVLLIAAKSTTERVEQETLRLINSLFGEIVKLECCRPLRHLRGDSFRGRRHNNLGACRGLATSSPGS